MERWVVRPDCFQSKTRKTIQAVHAFQLDVLIRRPLTGLAACVLLGRLLVLCLPARAAGLSAFAASLLFIRCFAVKPGWLARAILLVFLATVIQSIAVILPARSTAEHMSGTKAQLTGVVDQVVLKDGRPSRAVLACKNHLKVMLYLGQGVPELRPGDRIAARLFLNSPDRATNPGGFDEKRWLAGLGIGLKAYADGGQIEIKRRARVLDPRVMGLCARKQLNAIYAKHLSGQQAGVLSGLLLGDQSGLDSTVKTCFRLSGLSHLLAVSGAHVAWLMSLLSQILQKIPVSRRKRLVMMLILLLGFGTLCGWPVSVSRAILMNGCVLAGKMLQRASDPLSALSAAALVILVLDPYAALNLGFWLSFGATLGIVLMVRPSVRKRKASHRLSRVIIEQVISTACIQLILLPLTTMILRDVSAVILIANPIMSQIAMASDLSAFCISPLALILDSLSAPWADGLLHVLFRPLAMLLDLMIDLSQFASEVTLGSLRGPAINLAIWPVWLTVVAGILIRTNKLQGLPGRVARQVCRCRWGVVAGYLVILFVTFLSQPLFDVWMFDVGQGDAILIQSRTGQTVLIDGGTTGSAARVLIPAMAELGISRIDLAVVTHGHLDHAGGIIELMTYGRVRKLVLSKAEVEDEDFLPDDQDLTASLLETAKSEGIKVSEAGGNDTIALGKHGLISWIETAVVDDGDYRQDINDYSMIMLAELAGTRLLLTADCTNRVEEQLLADESWPAADLLKVAHHGSGLTTSTRLLEAVEPVVALISVGPNSFGHPAAQTIQRLAVYGCDVYRTDHHGALHLEIDQGEWRLKTTIH